MLGEFVESQIHEGLQTGYFQSTDWCWAEGMAEWQGLGSLFQRPQTLPQPTMKPAATAANPYAAPRARTVASQQVVLNKASNGARLGAVILDKLVLFACVLPAGLMSEGKAATDNDKTLMMTVGLLFLVVFLINLVLIGMFGQSIGKKMVGIRIANIEDGSKAGFFKIVLLRNFVAQGLLYLLPLYGLVDICFIFGDEQRCLHDKIAGTQVLAA